ncbi:Bug family tripartite tricarboxylate transporter substrate binding protein [Ensifer adhaerens]|uniref:Tripartite tricarboxylate transporter substrate-binding protein n=1 Tax=Ensifer adhaerens TaxID=106592 RepID=A0A9Q8YHY8_ENSAD|nr:tripartite tricarboxylate transporter substrate-binding protein [Ensifer adhaerens]USJ28430.1 tripartite tricarboxylate transporter substrate-binding protein [Ensifer adhaerens]
MKKVWCIALAVLGQMAVSAEAQEYPTRPVKVLTPLAAGSAVDVVARIVGEKMSSILGQQLYIENQPGAAGLIATRSGAAADPDGYTILAVNDSLLTALPNMSADAGYDPLTDFAPITQMVRINWALVANPDFPAKTVGEFIEAAKAKPDSIDYASGGKGSPQHIAMELFMQLTGTQLRHIPYKGATPAINDVVAGQVPVMFAALPTPLPFLESKQLQVLGTGAQKPLASVPGSQPVAEQGVPEYNYVTWAALIAPAKTPPEVLKRLSDAATAALADPGVRERLTGLGYEVVGNTPDQFAVELKKDFATMGEIIKKSGIKSN